MIDKSQQSGIIRRKNQPRNDFNADVRKSKEGSPYKGNWSCRNNNVSQGDTLYLIKLGSSLPRGIIASGYTAGFIYNGRHYNPDKRNMGVCESRIKVVFNRLLNYNNESILLQED